MGFNTIANICSILGLIVAFWQLYEVKKKIKSTQNALSKLRDVLVDQRMDALLKVISGQQEDLVRIITNMAKEGRSAKKNKDDIQNIILELNKCNNELPEKYKNISQGLENAIKELQDSLAAETDSDKLQKGHLLDADGYLKGCVHGLKTAVEDGLDKTVNVIARANY